MKDYAKEREKQNYWGHVDKYVQVTKWSSKKSFLFLRVDLPTPRIIIFIFAIFYFITNVFTLLRKIVYNFKLLLVSMLNILCITY